MAASCRLGVALATGALVLTAGAGLAGTSQVRATTDRPDDVAGPQVHFLYVVPRDGDDRGLDTSSVIARSVRLWQDWLRSQTPGRAFRVDTYQGELDISFHRLASDDATVASRGIYVRELIETELYAAGYDSSTKMYAVYYDGTSTWSCGGGDPQPTVSGSFSALYLKGRPPGAPSCDTNVLGGPIPGYLEFAMLHELVHSLGFVPRCAPHARGDYDAGHVSDSSYDLMWSGPEPWGTYQPGLMRLDVGRDDYYGHGRADCPDLAGSAYLVEAVEPESPPSETAKEPEPAKVLSFTTSRAARPGGAYDATLKASLTVLRGTCQARVGRRLLQARRVVRGRSVRCRWTIPAIARGTLRGTVGATTERGTVSRSFSRRIV